MTNVESGILSLPNEVLLTTLDRLLSRELLPIARTCRRIYLLIVRLLCHRLNVATTLEGYSLYLECYHPATRLRQERLFCLPIATDGLQYLSDSSSNSLDCVNQLGQLQKLYTRFRLQRRDRDFVQPRPGDIPGSRTYNAALSSLRPQALEEVVRDTVTVDANDLWAQLTTAAFLSRRDVHEELLWSKHIVAKGTIRVWRDWLSKHCQSRTFSDHTTVDVLYDQDEDSSRQAGQKSTVQDPLQDDGLLWLNTRDDSLGLRLKVKSQRRRLITADLLLHSDIDAPVSYVVHFEEVLIRAWQILLKIEEVQQQMLNDSERAIVLRSFPRAEV